MSKRFLHQNALGTVLSGIVALLVSVPSFAATRTDIRADAEVAAFDSNLPLVFISTSARPIQRDAKTAVSMKITRLKGGRSSLAAPADYEGRGNINLRGNTSLRYPKRSYHLETRKETGEPLKVSLLGMPKESDWVLYAPYSDKTLIRDVLAYELSNKMGQYAPRTRFVELFISYSDKVTMQDYMGVYVLEEKIKRGKDRVSITKLGAQESKEPEISGGYIFKKDHLDKLGGIGAPTELGMPDHRGGSSTRSGFPTGPGGFPAKPEGFLKPNGSSFSFNAGQSIPRKLGGSRSGRRPANTPNSNLEMIVTEEPFLSGSNEDNISSSLGFNSRADNQFFYVDPKPDAITAPQKAWLKRYIGNVERALYGPEFRDPATGYQAFIDADSFIDHHLLVEATKNVDGFRFSTFYYKDRGGKVKMGPIWDWNLAFGNVNGKQGWLPRYWYWPQLDDNQYVWFRRLFQDPDFGQKYVDRWAVLRTNVFATSNVLARVDQLAATLKEAQGRNFQRWPILGRTVWPNHFVGSSWQEEIDWLKNYIETRFAWIDDQFVAPPALLLKPGPVPPNIKLALTSSSSAAKIYYTLDGSDPRASGGKPAPSAKLYEAPLALAENTKLFARAFEKNLWSSPSLSEFKVAKRL